MSAETRDVRDSRERAWDRYWTEVHKQGDGRPGGFTRWALPFLRASSSRSVLDLGCGAGRDSCFLVEQGFSVTGIDSSLAAVGLAEKAVARLPAMATRR
jgi:2-polyprenyl-3-methyl-5-hydroxy-6-metoxy-1,4-benzoquinol methylase